MRDALGARMKQGEIYASNRIPPDCYAIIRVDGRVFHKYTENYGYKRPFDERFKDRMVLVGKTIVGEFGGLYAQTHSDECSILLPYDTDLFDRRQEKIVSVAASLATAAFAQADMNSALYGGGELESVNVDAPTFDARLSVWATEGQIIDYFHWRYVDSWVNCVSGYAYWTLRDRGYTRKQAHRATQVTHAEKHELLYQQGVNVANVPGWQKNGVAVFWETYQKDGYNPVTQEFVPAFRRRLEAVGIDARHDEKFKAITRDRMGLFV